MAKQTFTTGQVLTAAQMTSLQQTAMGGGAATAKTASYVLVAADAGTTVAMNAAGATTITVNTGLFAAGDTVFIQNLGAGVSTITAGTATVNTSATLALAQYEGGTLFFSSASASLFFKADKAAPAGGITSANSTVDTEQATTSTSFTDLTTVQTATLTTGTKALVLITAKIRAANQYANVLVGFAVSGATTIAASDSSAMKIVEPYSQEVYTVTMPIYVSTLTAGSNSFTMKFKTSSGTANFADRQITVIDLGS